MTISSVSYLMEKAFKVPLNREKLLQRLREDALEAVLEEKAGEESIWTRTSIFHSIDSTSSVRR